MVTRGWGDWATRDRSVTRLLVQFVASRVGTQVVELIHPCSQLSEDSLIPTPAYHQLNPRSSDYVVADTKLVMQISFQISYWVRDIHWWILGSRRSGHSDWWKAYVQCESSCQTPLYLKTSGSRSVFSLFYKDLLSIFNILCSASCVDF